VAVAGRGAFRKRPGSELVTELVFERVDLFLKLFLNMLSHAAVDYTPKNRVRFGLRDVAAKYA